MTVEEYRALQKPSGRKNHEREFLAQRSVIKWARMEQTHEPDLEWLHASANGGIRDATTARKLKEAGAKAGVSDLFLPCARGEYHGLYIEMKSPSGTLTESQERFIAAMRERGYAALVCVGSMEAIEKVKWYLKLKKTT